MLNTRFGVTAVLAFALTFTLGCGGGDDGASLSELEAYAAEADRQAQVNEAAAEQADKELTAAQARAKADRLASGDGSEIDTADYQRGQKLKGGSYLSTSLRAGIVAEQKLKMATVDHALNLFWGLEGRYPKSHEEFMEKVVEFNQIELEPLQEPYEYWYNAEDNTLYKRVKQEAIDQANAEAEAAEAAAAETSSEE